MRSMHMRLSSEGASGEGMRGLSVHRDEEADRPAGSLGMAHEGMSMLATEDGGDCSAAHLLCDAEGRGARRESIPFTSSLHAFLPLRKEVHCFCRPLRAAFMKAVSPSLSCMLPSLSASISTQVAWPFSAACMGALQSQPSRIPPRAPQAAPPPLRVRR